MKTILVWILVTTIHTYSGDTQPTYSPYLATQEDCMRLLNGVAGDGVYKRQCVQVRVLVKD